MCRSSVDIPHRSLQFHVANSSEELKHMANTCWWNHVMAHTVPDPILQKYVELVEAGDEEMLVGCVVDVDESNLMVYDVDFLLFAKVDGIFVYSLVYETRPELASDRIVELLHTIQEKVPEAISYLIPLNEQRRVDEFIKLDSRVRVNKVVGYNELLFDSHMEDFLCKLVADNDLERVADLLAIDLSNGLVVKVMERLTCEISDKMFDMFVISKLINNNKLS